MSKPNDTCLFCGTNTVSSIVCNLKEKVCHGCWKETLKRYNAECASEVEFQYIPAPFLPDNITSENDSSFWENI